MSSLATLARAAAPAAPFNSTFYATVATIIPVLFLALAVQGTALQALLDGGRKLTRDLWRAGEQREGLANWAMVLSGGMMFQLVQWVGWLFLVFAVIGEIQAITALDNQSAAPGAEFWVLSSVVVLTVLVAVPPAVALGRFQYDVTLSASRRPNARIHDKPGAAWGAPIRGWRRGGSTDADG